MPTYDLKCPQCETVVEMHCSIRDRNFQICEDCGGFLEITHIAPNNALLFFKEGFYEDLDHKPVYISSMKQLKRETEKRGQTSVYAEDSLCIR